jgi:hypothetical protein
MEISAHKTRSMFDRYDIVSEDNDREAARRIRAYAQNQPDESTVVAMESAVNEATGTKRAQS